MYQENSGLPVYLQHEEQRVTDLANAIFLTAGNLSQQNINRLIDFYKKVGMSSIAENVILAVAQSSFQRGDEIYTDKRQVIENIVAVDSLEKRLLTLSAEHLIGHNIQFLTGYFELPGEVIPLNGWPTVERTLFFIDSVLTNEQIDLSEVNEFICMNVEDNHHKFSWQVDEGAPQIIPSWLAVHLVGAAENAYSPRKGASDVHFSIRNGMNGNFDFIIQDRGKTPLKPDYAVEELLGKINNYNPELGLTEGGNGFPLAVRDLQQHGGRLTIITSGQSIEYIYDKNSGCWEASMKPTSEATEGTAVKFTVPKSQFGF